MNQQLLIIGQIFPEPSTTAAGGRMIQLINFFSSENFKIHFASTALISEKSADLESLGIKTHSIKLNDASFDEFLIEINPHIILFDRFITEEQFGWRVSEKCPNAIKILDTEDLHFLRKAREEVVKKGIEVSEAFLFSETAKRELASILRCDLSLIISSFEIELLQNTFKIAEELLFYLPFLIDFPSEEKVNNFPSFKERTDFITVGNLLHAPNVDSVEVLKKEIWPLIRSKIPNAKLHIYGAYAPQKILQLHKPEEGFFIKGWVENADEAFAKSRVCLAPIRFGAGLKGKLFDSVLNGTPFITTNIGAEGMSFNEDSFYIKDNFEEFVEAAISIYENEEKWKTIQSFQMKSLQDNFNKNEFLPKFKEQIQYLQNNIEKHRQQNFIGQILQHQTLQSTKYMSKWIEEKNK